MGCTNIDSEYIIAFAPEDHIASQRVYGKVWHEILQGMGMAMVLGADSIV